MQVFPTRKHQFKLVGKQSKTIDRLVRRTEKSKNLTSQPTEKSFRGTINGNELRVISSAIGKGAFCVMSGEIKSEKGFVKLEIHKAFKVLFVIAVCIPLVIYVVQVLMGKLKFNFNIVLIFILQLFFVRFFFIEFFFRWLSKESLNRFRDVLDLEWIKNQI